MQNALLIDSLYARGIRSIPSTREGEFLFSRDAATPPTVATAVRFGETQSAFTRGDLSLSDNFDAVPGRFVAVENLTFGPAKLFVERQQARAFVTQWPDARILEALAQFAKSVDRTTLADALEKRPEYRALHDAPDSALARMRFLDALAQRCLDAVDKEVLHFGRKKAIGLEDPIFAAVSARQEAMRSLVASGAATLDDYFAQRMALLDHVLHANPRFAKLAIGRLVWFPLVDQTWSRLSVWAVFLARRLQLARHPDLALPFLMLNREASLHCETSDKDDLWAVQIALPEGAESPLDALLLPGASAPIWDRLRAEAPTRKLGQANALVAQSLLLRAPLEGEAEAAAELRATGWVAWVDRMLPGEGSLLHPPPLPTLELPSLREWVEALAAGLADRKDGAQDAPAQ